MYAEIHCLVFFQLLCTLESLLEYFFVCTYYSSHSSSADARDLIYQSCNVPYNLLLLVRVSVFPCINFSVKI